MAMLENKRQASELWSEYISRTAKISIEHVNVQGVWDMTL